MKTATVTELKKELKNRSPEDLIEITLRLSKFKKENKELLTYLLFEADNEPLYIEHVKNEIELQFVEINTKSVYFVKKSIRKILRNTKKYIRYSKKTETEIELLMNFCDKMADLKPSYKNSAVLTNIYDRQIDTIRKKITNLHEDLQFDYERELEYLI
jgi:hypothetical protein